MTKDIFLALIKQMEEAGQHECAAALSLAWGGYLRASEVISVRASDLALHEDVRISHLQRAIAVVTTREAETGPLQFVPISDPEVIDIITAFKQRSYSNNRLFNLSYTKYRGEMKLGAQLLGLPVGHSTHSTRIGGALHDYCKGTYADTIAITSHWKSLNSLRHYLTNGRAWLLNMDIYVHIKVGGIYPPRGSPYFQRKKLWKVSHCSLRYRYLVLTTSSFL